MGMLYFSTDERQIIGKTNASIITMEGTTGQNMLKAEEELNENLVR